MKSNTFYTKPFYVFLDFDGVLHAVDPSVLAWPIDGARYRYAFHQSDLLEFTLKRHIPNARVVVSSDWRKCFPSIDDLRHELLGAGCNAGLVNRMVDMTPVFQIELDSITRKPQGGTRLKEILAYIEEHDLNDTPCLILDDDETGFTSAPNEYFPIHYTDPGTGFDFAAAETISTLVPRHANNFRPKIWFRRIDPEGTNDALPQSA